MRARNIKPGFFKNDDLAEIDPVGRLLFIGLWTLADRQGKLEDRVKRIKAELFPYDDLTFKEIDKYLDDLSGHGFIFRYEIENERFIKILNFNKHQKPHQNESVSVIPEPLDIKKQLTCNHGNKSELPKQKALGPDCLKDDCLKDERGKLKEESVAPQKKLADAHQQPDLIFQCQFFVIYEEFLGELLKDYPLSNRDWLILQFKKIRDYQLDNPGHWKCNIKGLFKSPKNIIRRWIENARDAPQDIPPETPIKNCIICNGSGFLPATDNNGGKVGLKKCSCWGNHESKSECNPTLPTTATVFVRS